VSVSLTGVVGIGEFAKSHSRGLIGATQIGGGTVCAARKTSRSSLSRKQPYSSALSCMLYEG
jgi:hypothetical protein